MRVLITEGLSKAGLALLEERCEVTQKPAHEGAALAEALVDADAVIVRSKTNLDRAAIESARRLKVIGRAGVGYDNIDLDAATRQGVLVMNVPDATTISACEHTFALLLGLMRHIPDAAASMRAGQWARQLVGRELFGKTLGVIGLGKIGSEVSRRAQAFGMRVIGHDPYVSGQRVQEAGIEILDLSRLLTQADVVTLHVPLTETTRHMIGAKELALLRKGAVVINCARGPLIDEEALVEALRSGHLGGAALDVYAKEPPDFTRPLFAGQFKNLICSPHLGASTEEAQERVSSMIAQQVIRALIDEDPLNSVNLPRISKEMLERVRPTMKLAERMGSFLMQWIRTTRCEMELAFEGEAADLDTSYVTLAALKGLLEPVSEGPVNFVSAPMLSRERGLALTQVKRPASTHFRSALVLRASAQRVATVGGGIGAGGQPRLVQIDDYHLDFPLAGLFLVIEHNDQPGVVGRVGTILGNSRVNIGRMEVCRQTEGERAMMIITVDNPLRPRVLENLHELDEIASITMIDLRTPAERSAPDAESRPEPGGERSPRGSVPGSGVERSSA